MRRLLLATLPLLLTAPRAPAQEVRLGAGAQAERAIALSEVTATGRATPATAAVSAPAEVARSGTAVARTPQAISVITEEQVREQGAQSVQEAVRYVAGVTGEAFGNDGRNDSVFVRGVAPRYYLDGLRYDFGFYTPRNEIYALERLEVLKGPAGSLYGSGSVGGVVNQVSKRPLFGRAAEVGFLRGTYDRTQVEADATGTLDAAGTLAGRLVAVGRLSDTPTETVRDDRLLIAPSLTWRPTAATSLTVLGRYQRDWAGTISNFVPIAASLRAAPGRRLPTDRFLGEPGYDQYHTETRSGTVLFDHAFGPNLRVGSRTRYSDAPVDYRGLYPDSYANPAQPFLDADRRRLNRFAFDLALDQRSIVTDHHVAGAFGTPGLRHHVLAGVDYHDYRRGSETAFGQVTGIDAYAPAYGTFVAPAPVRDRTSGLNQLGFYAQDRIEIGPRVEVTLGVRRDRATNRAEAAADQTSHATTYRAALLVDAGRGVRPYVSYAESFDPVVGADARGGAYQPRRGRQYEAGVKWQLAPAALLSVAAYQITETNRLTPDPVNPFFSIQTGEADLRGVEVEGRGRLAGFDLVSALTFADTEVTRSNTAAELGRPLPSVPRRQYSLFASRGFAVGPEAVLRLGGGVRHVGDSHSGDLRTPGHTLGDLFAALDWREWTLRVNANNVTDEEYYSTCLQRGDCFLGVRRTVVGSIRRRF